MSKERGPVHVDSGTTTISNNIIKNNADSTGYGPGYGVYAFGPEPLTLTNNSFSNNRRTANISASKTFTHSGNTSEDIINRGFEMSGIISSDTTFISGDLPFIINNLTIEADKTLTLEPGTILKMNDYYSTGAIVVNGNLIAKGTKDKKIYITSLKNDSVGGDTNGDGSASAPSPKNWSSIFMENGSKAEFDNVTVSYGGWNYNGEYLNIAAAIYQRGAQFIVSNSLFEHNAITDIFQDAGTTNITKSELKNGNYGIWSRGGSIKISESSLTNHTGLAIYNESGPVIDAKNNWWGDASGPNNIYDPSPTGTGDKISSNVDYVPFLTEPSGTIATCCSSVLFLPGLEASRLYKQKTVLGLPVEDQLWEPNTQSDVTDLYLDQNGNPINSDIYTKDIIDETNILPIRKTVIYKSLIQKLNDLASSEKIKEWKPYAYDWRQGIDDLIQNGTKYNNDQIFSLIGTLQSLIDSSKTGKVTIIAHSNGGLLAKELIKKLKEENNDLVNHIDIIVLVASPQLGTPEGLFAILHGYDQKLPLVMSETQARILAQNMPSAYGLLPSKKYFEQAGVSSLVIFDPTSSQIYKTDYGSDINNYTEEHNFILGQEGRTQPAESDLISPIKGNTTLLTKAESLHDSIDNMTFPSSIKVIDIAGWGKETIAGMKYTNNDLEPIYTIRGDKTVVIPSALYGQGIKYWLDLSQSKLQHSNILEDPQLLSFIGDLIQQKPPETVSLKDAEPIQIGNRLHLSVHSPVTIGVTDKNGNFTGKICDADTCYIQENIPGSTYQEFGEGKYVTLAEGNLQKVNMQGTDVGTFSFDFEKVAPDGTTQAQTFVDIPVTTQTKAEVTLNTTTQIPELTLDVTGDGKVDFTIIPKAEFDPILFLQIMRKTIESFDISKQQKNTLLNRIDDTIKAIQKGKINKAKLKIEQFKKILIIHPKESDKDKQERERKNEREHEKERKEKRQPKQLAPADIQALLTMLNQLLDNLNK